MIINVDLGSTVKIFTRSTISAKDLNWKRLEALDADNRDSDRATVVELMAKARRGLKEPTLGEAVRRPPDHKVDDSEKDTPFKAVIENEGMRVMRAVPAQRRKAPGRPSSARLDVSGRVL